MVEYGALISETIKQAGANLGNLLGKIGGSIGDAIGGLLRLIGIGA